jgi:hypothetical protein
MFKRIVTGTLVFGMAAAAPPAAAQNVCGARESLVTRLGVVYAEQLVGAGLIGPTHLVELWMSEHGATWTLLVSGADGRSCLLGSGTAWVPSPGPQTRADRRVEPD